MFTNIQKLRERYGVINRIVPERATTKERGRGFNVIAEKNIPKPWAKCEWEPDREIADLPSVEGDITGASGYSKTMYPQSILNPKFFEGVQKARRARATKEFRKGEANVALDGIQRGSKAARPIPKRIKAERLAARHLGGEQHSLALDNREKVQGLHPSEVVAIDGFFGESLVSIIPHRISQFLTSRGLV
ncbi:MAG: hypothetical protein ACW968_01310 [Candidatus Thorarchaeota archaeon]